MSNPETFPAAPPRAAIVAPAATATFEQRWLAEAVRLSEDSAGPADDASALRAARAAGGDLEQRIVTRASNLSSADRLRTAQGARRQHTAPLMVATLLLAAGAGSGAAGTVLGDGSRPVNIVWALSGLLGLHVLTLLLWLIGRWVPIGQSGSLAGQLWLWIRQRLSKAQPLAWVMQAQFEIARQARATYWWLGRLSHALWLTTLCTALLTLFFLLATRRYGFVWETTILPADTFVRLTQALALLPAALGITVPDATMVLNAGGSTAVDADRHAWSGLLVSALLLYGIVPRALLLLLCHFKWRQAQRRFRLDLTLPAYARLKNRLMPDTESAGICSAAPAKLPEFHAGHRTPGADHQRCLMALELADDLPWPPTDFPPAHDAGRIDSRETRHQALDQLAQHGAGRLLIAIDARLSPDRGALALIAELSRYADTTGAWLYGLPADVGRVRHWHEGLASIDLAAEHVFESRAAARDWLEAPNA
ncbi:DUF2868 domain-containing protein [Denitromonas iodatirespirans]|uniref:DUF2868 domain-containing protein n=1 Tax=Denitromonas iodatirespirans TaxID=2795389 RepID=A0A944DFK2_DENI1|nr:DUF2868 domain-containing protein [Denitromonas iodatirespirans]MBT0964176.1 DUF2868 domain-containing protein [Denitromonas iodatirespirans]